MELITVLIGLGGCVVGFVVAYSMKHLGVNQRVKAAEIQAASLLSEAEQKSANIVKEAKINAKDQMLAMQADFENRTKETRQELKVKEQKIIEKEERVDHKSLQIERRDRDLTKKERKLVRREEHVERRATKVEDLIERQKGELEKISGLTGEQAKELLIHAMENEARHEGAKLIKRIEAEAEAEADKKAKHVISTAIQRYAGDFVAERTVSVVQLPNDEMKGRIIGREGRNIRALEAATGIDLIIDDTPEAVILSGFNPVRREVARLSLMRLIADGRIHPARIEDVVKKVNKEIKGVIKEAGEQAAFDLGVHGIHRSLIGYLGSLKFRTSYTQNVLQHSVEVGSLCGIMAAELGLDEKLARRMGLLHDLGKSVDHEVEGPHAIIGSNLAKKHGESSKVVHAIAAHHEDVPSLNVYDYLVQAADSLSGARPGARKELLENYVKRLEELEKIAKSFKGVAQTYAIQAGREVRVMVESKKISDDDAVLLSHDIAKKIESDLTFPGQIKVLVIRETRSASYANK